MSVGLADDGKLARQVLVAEPDRDRPVGLGAQDARQSLDVLQRARMLLVREGEGGVLPVGPKEGNFDHLLDRVEGEQRRHQQADGHAQCRARLRQRAPDDGRCGAAP